MYRILCYTGCAQPAWFQASKILSLNRMAHITQLFQYFRKVDLSLHTTPPDLPDSIPISRYYASQLTQASNIEQRLYWSTVSASASSTTNFKTYPIIFLFQNIWQSRNSYGLEAPGRPLTERLPKSHCFTLAQPCSPLFWHIRFFSQTVRACLLFVLHTIAIISLVVVWLC